MTRATHLSAGPTTRSAVLAILLAVTAAPSAAQNGEAPAGGGLVPGWEFNLSLNNYVFPGDEWYLMPILTADQGRLHLEARYNYEDRKTASVWGGWRFAWEGEVSGEVVPIGGIVFGATGGVAPGLELDLTWWKVEFYSEFEYLFLFDDPSGNYFYAWSTLTVAPAEWLILGLVGQRLRVVESGLGLERGVLVGGLYDRFGLTYHWVNPFTDDVYHILTLDVMF
jgi:hypothetical protein